ncbi:hypothetical protein Tco_1028707 [Tanacetum coccineum]|uniref:Uncharacterized protein n=1 Tax=Tanacetum coccineum TaxID=301880 RepID=A0ABQ5G1D1_9ASTR
MVEFPELGDNQHKTIRTREGNRSIVIYGVDIITPQYGGIDPSSARTSPISSIRDSLSDNGVMRWRRELLALEIGLKSFRRSRRRDRMSFTGELIGKENRLLGEESIEMSRFSTDSTDQIRHQKFQLPVDMNGCLQNLNINSIYLVEAICQQDQ